MNHKLRRVVSLPLLIDQNIGTATNIETMHDKSFFIHLVVTMQKLTSRKHILVLINKIKKRIGSYSIIDFKKIN